MNTFIIRSQTSYHFWNGKKFVAEYPDAKVWATEEDSVAIATMLRASGYAPEVIMDYGLATERIVWPKGE